MNENTIEFRCSDGIVCATFGATSTLAQLERLVTLVGQPDYTSAVICEAVTHLAEAWNIPVEFSFPDRGLTVERGIRS